MSAPRLLPVDLSELCIAMSADGRWYLDVTTGDVILVSHEYDPNDYDGLSIVDIEDDPHRFVRVPAVDPAHLVADMKAFAQQLSDARLKESLELAFEAPRPDRRFKAALDWLPEVKHRWHVFRGERVSERARAWVTGLGIVVQPRPDAA